MLRLTQEVQEGEKKEEEKEKEKKKEVEPNFQLLENPARAMPAQLKVLTMPETCRYQPFKPVNTKTTMTTRTSWTVGAFKQHLNLRNETWGLSDVYMLVLKSLHCNTQRGFK